MRKSKIFILPIKFLFLVERTFICRNVDKIHLITCFRHKIIVAWHYQEFLIIAGRALSDELVKFLKTRHFDWITLQNLVLFAEIVQTTFSRDDLQIQKEITQRIL